MKPYARALMLLASILAGREAAAACAVGSAVPADFGALGSIALDRTEQDTSTVDAGLQCAGTAAQPWVAGTGYFRLGFTSAGTGMVGPAGDVVPYRLHVSARKDNASLLAPGATADLAALGVIDELGILQAGSAKAIPLFLQTVAGSNVAAGSYTDTVTLAWDWSYCLATDGNGACTTYDAGSGVSTFQVRLQVQNECAVVAGDISFGSAPVPSAFPVVSASIAATCTKGSAYSIGLGEGQNAAAGRRNMRSAAGDLLAYDIFQGNGALRWGSQGSERRDSAAADTQPGKGLGVGAQGFTYNAKVYPDQSPVPAGHYTDIVVIDAAF